MVKTQICRVQSPFPCDYTHTRAHKQKLVLAAVSKWKPSPEGMQCGWIFLDCLVVSGHGADPSQGGKCPGTAHKARRNQKSLWARGGRLQGCSAHTAQTSWGTVWLLSMLRALWASSSAGTVGCPQEPSLPKVTTYHWASEGTQFSWLPAEISVLRYKIVLHEPPQSRVGLLREGSVLLLPN